MSEESKSCWPWSHQWEQWQDCKMRYTDSDGRTVSRKEAQVRYCTVCRKKEVRLVEV